MNKTLKAKRAELEGAPIYYVCPNCSQWLATEDEQGATILHPQIVPRGDSFVFPAVAQGYLTTVEGQAKLAELEIKMNQASEAGEWVIAKNIKQTIKIFSDPAFPRPDWRPISITQAVRVVCQCGALDLVTPKVAEPRQSAAPVNESIAHLSNTKADRDLYRGLMLYPNQWGLNEYLANCYHNGSEGHVVIYQPSEVERALGDAPNRALDALEKRFKELRSEIVADVIDILFHHWHKHKDPKTNAVAINAAKLCQYREKVPEGENLRLHWEALRDAFSFALRDSKGDLNAKLFFYESKDENSDGPGARYVYSPGFMLQYALSGQPLYVAPFLQKVWALSPKDHNEAKRLARYLRADWRMNTEKYLTAESGAARAARWHSWAFLLAESGVDVQTHRNSKNPKRLIETIARAVETLYQMEVIAEGGFDIYHPDDRKAAENLPTRGALDAWIALRVCLAPSAKLREALLETDGKRRAGRARDAKAVATERAKKQIRAEGKTKTKK